MLASDARVFLCSSLALIKKSPVSIFNVFPTNKHHHKHHQMFFSVSHQPLSTTTQKSFSFRPSKPRVRFGGRLHAAARDKKTDTPLRYGFPGEIQHHQRRKERTTARAAGGSTQTKKEKKDPAHALRTLLNGPAIVQAPCAHDALSARLIERAGFSAAFMSGFCVSASHLALPDVGLISYAEMQDVGGRICDAVSPNFPIIGDADDGYGNAMSAKRTVEGYIKAGFAGILIEDQMAPKRCGHTGPRPVCDRETSVARVRAACDARDESLEDIVVFARSDARGSMGLDEALERVKAYVDAGADAVFIDALQSKEEMQRFCDACPDTPKIANMLEGGGMTPICQPRELHAMGFKIVAYPLSMLAVSVKAMETALQGIMFEGYPDEELLPTFEELKDAVGMNEYLEESRRYKLGSSSRTPA